MRHLSIDMLRTAAIVIMVQVHFVGNLSGFHNPGPGGFGAPLFAFLLGVSYSLWLEGPRVCKLPDSERSKISIRRGLFLLGVGFLFNIFVWLPEDTFIWDILTFLGVGLIVLNGARKLPHSILLMMCAAVFVISPILRELTDFRAYWTNNTFDFDVTLSDVLLGFLVNGYFPVFPWIIYPLAGFMVASRLMPPGTMCAPATLNRFTWLGAGLFGAWIAVRLLGPVTPSLVQAIWLDGWTMFPASVEYILGTMAIAITAFALLHRWVDRSTVISKNGHLARVCLTFGPRALTVYVLHHLVHIWPLWIFGLIRGTEPTAYWQKAMPIAISWPLAFVFLAICYYFLRWMERTGKPGMETWMRWLCD